MRSFTASQRGPGKGLLASGFAPERRESPEFPPSPSVLLSPSPRFQVIFGLDIEKNHSTNKLDPTRSTSLIVSYRSMSNNRNVVSLSYCYFEAPVGYPDRAGRRLLGACSFIRSSLINRAPRECPMSGSA